MKYILILIGILFPVLAYSSLPLQVSLEELIENSDHLLIGHVVGVDMIDGKGQEITDPSARTGPGSKNLIRLIVKVDEVIVSIEKAIPDTLKVPLDPRMHYSLGQIKEAHSSEGGKFLLLLKGSDFQPPFAGVFGRSLSEKNKIIELMKSNRGPLSVQHKSLKSDAERRALYLQTIDLKDLCIAYTENRQGFWVASVKDRDGHYHTVTVDSQIGKNLGLITKITNDTVEVVEIIQESTGGYVERPLTLKVGCPAFRLLSVFCNNSPSDANYRWNGRAASGMPNRRSVLAISGFVRSIIC